MKKIVLILGLVGILVSGAFGEQHFVKGTVPHYYEFGNDNPGGTKNHWCGHTALKSVGKYITGNEKTLESIHNTFWYNSAGYRANNYCLSDNNDWCSKLQDLLWASKLSQNGGYGKSNSVVRSVYSYSQFLTKIKDGIINNFPIIVPSNWGYTNSGHFWVITGYEDSTTGNDEDTIIYLRDVAEKFPINDKYDNEARLKDFYDERGYNTLQLLYMKRD